MRGIRTDGSSYLCGMPPELPEVVAAKNAAKPKTYYYAPCESKTAAGLEAFLKGVLVLGFVVGVWLLGASLLIVAGVPAVFAILIALSCASRR